MRPGVQLLAYDDHGWTEHAGQRTPLDSRNAQRSVELLKETDGDVAVSKCSFPRHAVVLYEGDVPVASINVCFECGDIVLWPAWKPEPEWNKLTDKQRKALDAARAQQMKRYEEVFPKWKQFFRDDVGLPLENR